MRVKQRPPLSPRRLGASADEALDGLGRQGRETAEVLHAGPRLPGRATQHHHSAVDEDGRLRPLGAEPGQRLPRILREPCGAPFAAICRVKKIPAFVIEAHGTEHRGRTRAPSHAIALRLLPGAEAEAGQPAKEARQRGTREARHHRRQPGKQQPGEGYR